MSVLKATSWGRTRGPKTLVGVQGGEVDVVAVSTLTDVTDGYSTENQRFLHVLLVDKNASTNLTVTIYGYSHAFQKWFPLETLTQGLLNSSNAATLVSAAATITVADSGEAEADQDAADRKMSIFNISGIDRVAFVGTTADVRCYAACSTF
jgi:hypothetical protein